VIARAIPFHSLCMHPRSVQAGQPDRDVAAARSIRDDARTRQDFLTLTTRTP